MNSSYIFVLISLLVLCSAQNGFQDLRNIDTFDKETDPIVIVIPENPSFPIVEHSTTLGTAADGIIGNERNLELTAISGFHENVLSTSVSNDSFISTTQQDASGRTLVQYDGADGSSTLNPGGLYAVNGLNTDLTRDGAFAIHAIMESDLPTGINFRVYSGNAGDYCSFIQFVPGDDTLHDYFINFNEFDTVGDGCSFNSVGAIEVEVELLENVDVIITLLAIWGPIPVTPSPSQTRTPSLTPIPPSPSTTPIPPPLPSDTCICRCPVWVCHVIRHDDGDYYFYNNFFVTFFNPGFFNFGFFNFFGNFFFFDLFFFFQNYFFDIWYGWL